MKEGEKPSLRPFARKKAATSALLAVINSAADNIHGGLYDPESEAIVQVDGLLTLLGEALPFVNRKQPPSTLFPTAFPFGKGKHSNLTNLFTKKTSRTGPYPLHLAVLRPRQSNRRPRNSKSTRLRPMRRMLPLHPRYRPWGSTTPPASRPPSQNNQ